MKPPPFEYVRPHTLEQTLALLRDHPEEAKVLAGGQSLVPLLNFRLARPRLLIDINGLTPLGGFDPLDGGLSLGALVRQRVLEDHPIIRDRAPILREVARQIGHPAIRTRGTVGGSLAHADPSAELPVVMVAADATLVVRSVRGERQIPAGDFFLGYFTTALAPDELLTEVRVPGIPATWAFVEVSRRLGDFAIVAACALLRLDEHGVCQAVRVALGGVGPVPVLVRAAGQMVGQRPTPALLEEVGRQVSAEVEPDSDVHASAEYRRHLAGVLTRRALEQALARVRAKAGEAGR